MRKPYVIVFVSLAAAAMVLSACGDSDDDGDNDGDSAVSVDATLTDFEIELDKASVPAGEVTFNVTNDGPSIHEFVVFKTDLAEDDLPKDASGDVAESDEFAPVDEIEDIEEDATPTLTVNLEAGSYVIICNVAAHYGQGMHTAFKVT